MKGFSATRAVFYCRNTIIAKTNEQIVSLGIDKQVEYKMIDQESKDKKPWGDQEFDILVLSNIPCDQVEEFQNNNPCIKWIHTLSAGVDNLCSSQNFVNNPATLTNAKGAFSKALGEYIAFGVLFHAKFGQRWVDMKSESNWAPTTIKMVGGSVLGIVGYGDIGYEVAKCCKNGLGMKVIGYKRDPSTVSEQAKSVVDEVVGSDKLGYLQAKADYVVNIMPLTPDTKNFWTIEKFSQMKPTAVFMNIGRGPSVNEDDLCEALESKKIAGAVQDVYATEPLPKESKLWKTSNVFMTPHCGDVTEEFYSSTFQVLLDNIVLYKQSGVANLKNIVNKTLGY